MADLATIGQLPLTVRLHHRHGQILLLDGPNKEPTGEKGKTMFLNNSSRMNLIFCDNCRNSFRQLCVRGGTHCSRDLRNADLHAG